MTGDIDLPLWSKVAVTVGVFLLFWGLETLRPLFAAKDRLRHAGRNLLIALGNTALLTLVFASATVAATEWTAERSLGLLPWMGLDGFATFGLALLVLDGWTYLWHRANHAIPLLWRFHRMHHSDDAMDVTTATRFHLGELAASSLLRLGLIPLLGLRLSHLLTYDLLLLTVTHLHHANLSLGRWDRVLSWFIVTPALHRVHHSRLPEETNSNFASVLSIWDRLARTLRRKDDASTIRYGLDEFDDPYWQSVPGMLATPFVSPDSPSAPEDPVRFPSLRVPTVSRGAQSVGAPPRNEG